MYIPKVTIDENEFVRLNKSGAVVSSVVSSDDIWGEATVTIGLLEEKRSLSLELILDRLGVFGPPLGPSITNKELCKFLFFNSFVEFLTYF